jgi:nicotinamide mononucleotide transporter
MSLTINASALWEFFAVALGLIYIVLAARHSLYAWIASGISATIYGILLWQDVLPMQAGLHAFYVITAFIGWHHWRKTKQLKTPQVHYMTKREHLVFISAGTLFTLIIGSYLAQNTLSQSPWLDTSTTVFSMLTTWLVVKQRIENWLYWILIDSVSALLYWQTEHQQMALLYLLYVVLAVYGFYHWRKRYLNTPTS